MSSPFLIISASEGDVTLTEEIFLGISAVVHFVVILIKNFLLNKINYNYNLIINYNIFTSAKNNIRSFLNYIINFILFFFGWYFKNLKIYKPYKTYNFNKIIIF